ncbi:hypothetical protein E2C01_069483 [Portunus trituberculatus]|uniref:Uncharacterized protein n=1 Tax=Portunus trituberculatus TaxID=210409 RepID=A0A5B7I2C1_PORTR|nr:hypothetical protein [Portunus trituberculatus]
MKEGGREGRKEGGGEGRKEGRREDVVFRSLSRVAIKKSTQRPRRFTPFSIPSIRSFTEGENCFKPLGPSIFFSRSPSRM